MGKLIVIEGPNFSGKTTIKRDLAEMLVAKGYSVFQTEEPTTSKLGEFVKGKEGEYSILTYAFLIFADREYHIENEIIPALALYDYVITDRFIESSYVLQGYELGNYELLDKIYKNNILSYLTILCLPPTHILEKRRLDRSEFSHFEKKLTSSEERTLYLQVEEHLKKYGRKYMHIDTSKSKVYIDRLLNEVE